MQKAQHPVFQVGGFPGAPSSTPQLCGQVFHQQHLVVWDELMLSVVPRQPLLSEGLIEISRAYGPS